MNKESTIRRKLEIKNPNFSKRFVSEYYNRAQTLFSLWSKEHVHYGIWDENTKTLEEATLNTTKFVAEYLELEAGDVVLDAGCGVGGTSRYIASNYGVKTIGITISDEQVKKAKELSSNMKNGHLLEFYKQDFTQTTFPDETFTKIFALESICYAPDKQVFLNEVYRLLKSGGKLVVVDGFQTKFDLNEEDKKVYLDFLNGWSMAEFAGRDSFVKELQTTGFKSINFYDYTEAVGKTVNLLHKVAKRWSRLTWILSKMRLIPKAWHNTMVAGVNQKLCLDRNIGIYGVFVAEK